MACCIVLGMIMANIFGVSRWLRSRARTAGLAVLAMAAVTVTTVAVYRDHLDPRHMVSDLGSFSHAAGTATLAHGEAHHHQ